MTMNNGINEFRTESGTLKYWADPTFPSTTHLIIEIPLKDFNYSDEALRNEVLRAWSNTRHFPSRFKAMNKFIDSLEGICHTSQFFLNATKNDNGYENAKCVFVLKKYRGLKLIPLLEKLISF